MDRKKYNSCIKLQLAGKHLTRVERKQEFCIAAKMCAGKSSTREEAARVCLLPKLKKGEPQEPEMTCPQRKARALSNLDTIMLKLKTGDTEGLKLVAAMTMTDIVHCQPADIHPLASDVLRKVNELSARYYLKGEARELTRELNLLKTTMGGEG